MQISSFISGLSWRHIFPVVLVIMFASTSLIYWPFTNSWLEQQRVAELILALFACLSFALIGFRKPIRHVELIITAVFALGLVSSLLAEYPLWAMKEWAKCLGLYLLAYWVAKQFSHPAARHFLGAVVLTVAALLALQFLAFYTSAFVSGTYNINPDLLYPGFDNPRFYGQVMVMLLPLLTWLVLYFSSVNKRRCLTLGIVISVVQWMILIALAGRGSWLGLFLAHMVLFFLAPRFRRLITWQCSMATGGLLLYGVMFHLIPWILSISAPLRELDFGLSRREVLWQGAWDMALAHPWLGVGPLHFSAVWNHIGAHPHQAFLQWAAEWGFVATLLAVGVAACGMWHGLSYLRNNINAGNLDAALWLALAAVLVLAQVDGVFVMPYTETWLAIIAGLAMARWQQPPVGKVSVPLSCSLVAWGMRGLSIAAALVIVCVLLFDVPYLYDASNGFWAHHKIGSPPRFWDQGWIPMEFGQE